MDDDRPRDAVTDLLSRLVRVPKHEIEEQEREYQRQRRRRKGEPVTQDEGAPTGTNP